MWTDIAWSQDDALIAGVLPQLAASVDCFARGGLLLTSELYAMASVNISHVKTACPAPRVTLAGDPHSTEGE
jgi:hypothetical protein